MQTIREDSPRQSTFPLPHLHEDIHWTRWMGVALIVIGAALVSYSEKMKHQPLGPAPKAIGPSVNGE